jgi:hypothetical protein
MEKEIWANARSEDQKLIQAIIALSEVVKNETTLNFGTVEWPTIQTLALAGGRIEMDYDELSLLTLIIKVGSLNIYAFRHLTAAAYEEQTIAFGGDIFNFKAGKQFTLIDNAYLVP